MRHFSQGESEGASHAGDAGSGREVRERPRALVVGFDTQEGRLQGSIVRDTQDPPRRKIVFVAGYRPETASAYRGALPEEGEVWECEVVRDTNQDRSDKGALIVRPLRKLEGEEAPGSQMRAWFHRAFPDGFVGGDSSAWEQTLPRHLDREGFSGARLVFGDRRLFAVKDGRVTMCHPYHDEGGNLGRSSPFRWGFFDALKYYDQAPPEIQALLADRKAEEDAREQEKRDKIAYAQEHLGELEAEMKRLDERARALGLKGGGITSREGFGGGAWSFDYGSTYPMSGNLGDLPWGLGEISKDLDEVERVQKDERTFRSGITALEPRMTVLRFKGAFVKDYRGKEGYQMEDQDRSRWQTIRGQAIPRAWNVALTSDGLRRLEQVVKEEEDRIAQKYETARRGLDAYQQRLREEQERKEQAEDRARLLAEDLISWSCWTPAERAQLRTALDEAIQTRRGWGGGLVKAVGDGIRFQAPFDLSRLRNLPDMTPPGSPIAEWRKVLKFQPFDGGLGEYTLDGVDRYDKSLMLGMAWHSLEGEHAHDPRMAFGDDGMPSVSPLLLPAAEGGVPREEAPVPSRATPEIAPARVEEREREPVGHEEALRLQREVGRAGLYVDVAGELWKLKSDRGTQKRLQNWRGRSDAFAQALTQLAEADATALRERSEKLALDARQIAMDAARENRKDFQEDWPSVVSEGIGRAAAVAAELDLELTSHQEMRLKDNVVRFVIERGSAPDEDTVFDWVTEVTA